MNDKPVMITSEQSEQDADCACADKALTVTFDKIEEGVKQGTCIEELSSGPWMHFSTKHSFKKAGSKGIKE